MNAERVFTALLCLYPRAFREEYGAEMIAAFADLRERHRGRALALWAFVVADTLRAAGRERLPRLRWLASAAFGLLTTTAVSDGATWAYHYFYHPYLEGTTIRGLPYGILLGVVLGGSVGAAQWLLFEPADRRASRWGLASAAALPVAVLFCSTAFARVSAGVNPLVASPGPSALDLFVLGLAPLTGWPDLTAQCAAMAATAFVARVLLFARTPERRHARS